MEEEVARSNNIQKNSLKWYKSSSIQTRQNALQDNTDRISRLPDSLLLHILCHLGIEEVTKTSLLSKRWRYLWTSIPCLDFRSLGCERRIKKTTFIDRFLFHHDESKVDKLCIRIKYKKKHVQLVDSWIHFAIRHKVEELRLDFFDGEFPEGSISDYILYKLPHSLFRCGWLTILQLCGCDLNLPATIQFNSLNSLFFRSIDLEPFAIEHITSNCPLLEELRLTNCNKWIDLNICITNDNIKNLNIFEFGDLEVDNGITTINAPNVITLQFVNCLGRTNFHIEELRSLVIVDFYTLFGGDSDDVRDVLYGKDSGCGFAQLLNDLRYVKEVRLNSWCIQALTAREIRGLDLVSINATCIRIGFGLTKWELPGIAYLLQSASHLQKLVIYCCRLPESELSDEFVMEYDFEEKQFWKLRELDSSSILQNIKSIKIKGYRSTIPIKDVRRWDREIELVRFLLKTSKVLERMTIKTCISIRNNMDLMFAVTQKLTSFPRASPNAGLFIS